MITQLVESARKATAPIVGIPMEGEAPFCLRRSLLVDSLKGLKIIDAAVQLALDGREDGRRLVVYASGDRVQAIRRFVPIHRNAALLPQWEWADKQREKRKRPAVKLTGRDKEIAKWQKKLARLGKPRAPEHPLLPSKYAWKYPEGIGQQWAQWKREAHIRRWIQAQARVCQAGKATTTQLYRILAERGLRVTKWSDVPTRHGDKYSPVSFKDLPDIFAYLNRLWEFCGIASKPKYYFDPESESIVGPELYKNWLEHLHEYKQLAAMIEGVINA
jgi:hypothetical protein